MSSQINGIANTNNDISIENNIIKLPLITTGNINLFAGSTNNTNLSSISSNIVPDFNNNHTLGTIEKQWSNAYIRDLSTTYIDVSVNLNPLFNDTSHLSSINKKWNIAYIKDLSNVNNINGQQYISNPNILTTTTNIYPLINDSISLGIPNKSWRNVNIRDLSTTNISVSGNIILNICGGTITNINKLTAPASDYKITSTTRLYQEISGDISWNAVNGYYGLAKEAYPALNPYSNGVKAVQTWTNRNINGAWTTVCWSPKLRLFVASSAASSNNLITSNDGINWNIMSLAERTSYPNGPSSAYVQAYMCWSPELKIFVAVSGTNTNNIMYSSNGTTWEYITKSADLAVFNCISWSAPLGIFVIIVINRDFVYISKDGKTWDQVTIIKSINDYVPQVVDMCWSSELGIFLAVGNNSKVMTSKNGRNWNLINVGIITSITCVCWSKELGLFVAFCRTGTLVSISNNGTQWTHINIGIAYTFGTVAWSPQLGLFVAGSNANTILTSPDGIKWNVNNSSGNFLSSCWSPELGIHVAVGTNTIVTSSLKARPPTSYNVFDSSFNNIDESGNWTFLSSTITSAYIRNLSVSSITITNNINPLTNNTGNLGSATNYWGNAYIRDLSIGSIDISVNLNPLNNTSGSLGGPRKIWSNAYINDLSIGSIDVSVNLNPLINASGSLGLPSRRWDNAYMRDLSVSSIDISVNINPQNNTRGSLGTFNKYWGNAYIRDLSISSIDVSVNLNPLIPNTGSLGTFTKYWGNAYIRDLSATNISISGNIIFNISGGAIININNLTAPASDYKITTTPRLYQEISGDISSNVFNCYYGLAKEAYPGLNPLSSGVKALSGWLRRTVTNDSVGASLNSIVWSSKRGMFVCGGMNGLVYSSDGIIWTFHNPGYSTSTWVSVTWSNELNLFVAVSNVGGNNIIRSSNATAWPDPITVDNNSLSSICWSSERMLFVVVCSDGSNRVRTSINAINWNSIDVPASTWSSVCWSPELMIFVAVASTGNKAMYSSDGSNNWITTTVETSSWTCVCWSPELGLFAALASNGTFRAMTSYNGKNWNRINIPQNTSCYSICWVSQLGLFIGTGSTGSTSIIIYSSDGILWTTRVSGSPVGLSGIAWCPEFGILASVGGQRMVITSSLRGRTPISYSVFDSPYNSIDETGRWTFLNTKTTTGFIRDLSSLNIDISTNLNPLSDNNGNLGGPRKLWGNAYIRDLSISSIDISVNLNPLIPNNGSIGLDTNRWGNIHTVALFVNGVSVGSDDRIKHNEVIITNGLTIIDQLTPKFYQKTLEMLEAHYYGDLTDYRWNYESGLIAQELLQINDLSFVVSGGDYYDSNNILIQNQYSVNYNSVYVYGLAAIKELDVKVKNQESIINSLLTRIEALENKL